MNVSLLNVLRHGRTLALAVLATAAITSFASADTINVVNGSFSSTTHGGGQLGYNTNVTGWTTDGYNFVYTGVASATSGVDGQYGNVGLWTSHNNFTVSPDGGNFLALDGAYGQAPVSQTLTGFNAGDLVTVSFYFAGAQQSGFDGATTEQLKVSLGGQSLYTEVLNDSSHGFTGWYHETLTFTATGSSEVLSFLAIGTPSGVPPMSLLDGVSVTSNSNCDPPSPVPEPGSLALMATGFVSLGGYVRARFKK
ncbi:MAG: hypothetical protein JWM43_2892 [Acidobacteriaceae bacterium]|nr:hypothetical protein [Acidobacteriaceae bacterium]